MLANNKMQQIPFIDFFIDLFESALHDSGDKLAHLQEHFFDCIYRWRTLVSAVMNLRVP
jgi:hypothetical protein